MRSGRILPLLAYPLSTMSLQKIMWVNHIFLRIWQKWKGNKTYKEKNNCILTWFSWTQWKSPQEIKPFIATTTWVTDLLFKAHEPCRKATFFKIAQCNCPLHIPGIGLILGTFTFSTSYPWDPVTISHLLKPESLITRLTPQGWVQRDGPRWVCKVPKHSG